MNEHSDKTRGFASLSPEQLKAVSRKGGIAKNSSKGWGSMTPEQRIVNVEKARQTRLINKLKKEEQSNEHN